MDDKTRKIQTGYLVGKRIYAAIIFLLEIKRLGEPAKLQDVAQKINCSVSYMEVISKTLRDHGLISTARGPNGGYTLARPLKEINVAEIMEMYQTKQVSFEITEIDRRLLKVLRELTLDKFYVKE